MIVTPEEPRHAAAIEALLDRSFGPDRHTKTAYRLRDGVAALPELSLVAIDHDDLGREVLEGTIRYWPVLIGGLTPSLLLGPIAVTPHWQGGGLGSKLIRMSLNKAAAAGHRSVILVGDAPYYGRFGFTRDLTLGLELPGPVDPARFLGLELVPGALAGAAGPVGRWHGVSPAIAAPEVALATAIPNRPRPASAAAGLWYAGRAAASPAAA
ncbi:GNAT family N-acetyltransferase [Azospirillum halopraeferens]|uniref:GNAT family N-acetyltransferase n=1 Tax=Azospirillum halopraeferens TaxID=34010 RepID=UPI00040AA671|nr:N-acetyltransferase [Azospirillum halopraeferens]